MKDIGLSQYSTHFENERIDGRVLNTLTRKDLDKLMNITRKFHQVTILHGVELLRLVEFDKRVSSEDLKWKLKRQKVELFYVVARLK